MQTRTNLILAAAFAAGCASPRATPPVSLVHRPKPAPTITVPAPVVATPSPTPSKPSPNSCVEEGEVLHSVLSRPLFERRANAKESFTLWASGAWRSHGGKHGCLLGPELDRIASQIRSAPVTQHHDPRGVHCAVEATHIVTNVLAGREVEEAEPSCPSDIDRETLAAIYCTRALTVLDRHRGMIEQYCYLDPKKDSSELCTGLGPACASNSGLEVRRLMPPRYSFGLVHSPK
jgi:hypothetical protein